MKTLNEVIKALEDATPCLSALLISKETYKDALHYLRQLKLFRQTPLMQSIHKAQKENALYPVEDWGEDEDA